MRCDWALTNSAPIGRPSIQGQQRANTIVRLRFTHFYPLAIDLKYYSAYELYTKSISDDKRSASDQQKKKPLCAHFKKTLSQPNAKAHFVGTWYIMVSIPTFYIVLSLYLGIQFHQLESSEKGDSPRQLPA